MGTVTAAAAQTTVTPHEIHVRTDLDGDGRADFVALDRADGSFRAAYQTTPGVLTWAPARASGAPGAAWATAGRFGGFNMALAVASPEANFVSVFPAPAVNSSVVPVMVPGNGVGPSGVVATDIGGAGNTADDDLVLVTGMNNAPDTHRRELVRHTGGGAATYTPISQAPTAAFRAGGRQPARDGGPLLVGMLEGTEGAAVFRLLDFSSGAAVERGSTAGMPGSGFVSARFGLSAWHTFLFWRQGQPGLAWRPAASGGGDNVQFAAGGVIDTGRPIGEVAVLPGPGGNRLLVVAADGATAAVFAFDGAVASLVQEMTAPEGEGFTGAVPREGGGFTLLGGPAGSGRSVQWRDWQPDGNGYAAGGDGALPVSRAPGLRANVFLFASEPFVTPVPGLVAALNAPEWSSAVQFTGNPAALSVTTEVYLSGQQGLGSSAAHPLGNAPAGTAHALSNQLRPDTSLASLRSRLGPAGMEVKISPPPGTHSNAVTPVFTATPGNAGVFARLGSGPWTPAASFAPRLTSAATVQYYALRPGSQVKTAVFSATYTFSTPARLIDSDGDGVPDFVEDTLPPHATLDPHSGQDPDGDGFSDLEEWLDGTNPLDAASKPATRPAHGGSFTVRGALRPMDGTTETRTTAAAGVTAEVVTPDGTRLGGGATAAGVPGFAVPALNIRGLASLSPLAAVLSQAVYRIDTPAPQKERGRELAALLPVPRLPVPKIEYTPGNGTTAQEVAAWKAAALAARNASQPVLLTVEPTEHHVLTTLVFERWLNETALARALPGVASGNLTVLPSRPGDASRRVLAPDEFDGLRRRVDDARPAWNVHTVHAALVAALQPPGAPAQAALRAVATDIYRVSSRFAVDAAAPDYLPPLDVLREFVRTGTLPAPYAAASTVPPADRTAAFQSIAPLLAALAPRPLVTLDLQVTPQTFTSACPVLDRVGAPGQVSLIAAEGVPYQLPESFTLAPGARIRVSGHPDIVDPDCPGDELEVISLAVVHLPTPPAADLDQNLLPDAWDCFFFAGGGEPLADGDGDGFSNLQELLDGTDPMLAESNGDVPVDLGPPQLTPAVLQQGGKLTLQWQYPAAYTDDIVFVIQCSDGLNGWVNVATVPAGPGGAYHIELPLPPDPKKFYRAVMSLAD